MEKPYKISIMLIEIATILISCITLHNEDISVIIFGTFVFTMSAFFASLMGAFVSRKIIGFGDKLPNFLLQILYYIVLPIVLLLVCYVVEVAVLIFLIIPYIQALIVLAVRKLSFRT